MKERSIDRRCRDLRDSVLDVVVTNFDYFKENKPHLAWALMNFDLIHRSARLAYNACQDNGNDSYRKVARKMSKGDEEVFSNAWDITQRGEVAADYPDNESCKEFAGYTSAAPSVEKNIRERIEVLMSNPLIADPIEKYKELGKTRKQQMLNRQS